MNFPARRARDLAAAIGTGWRSAVALAAVALACQGAFLLDTSGRLAFRYPLVDAAAYYHQACAVAAGLGSPGPFWQPPGYPYALALLVRLAGTDAAVLRAVQALLLAPLTALLLWRVALRLLPPAWAFAAAAATCLTGPLLFYASQLLPAMPAAALVCAALLLALRAGEKPAFGRWLLAGLAAGAATVFVATAAALLPVFAGAALLAGAGPTGARLRRAAAVAAGALLAIAPVGARNYAVCGLWVWLSTNSGANLYVGNSRDWNVTLAVKPGLDWDRLMRLPWLQEGAKNAVESDRAFRRLALRDVSRAPLTACRRLARKALAFWHGRELPRNFDLYGWRGDSLLLRLTVWRAGLCFPAGLLVPLAVAGVWSWRRRREALLLAASCLAFGLLVAVYFPTSRYRVPVLPALVLFACGGAHALWLAAAGRRRRPLAALAGLVLAAGAAAHAPLRWPTDAVRYDAQRANAIGAAADVRGDTALARRQYEEALRLDPAFADAAFNLGCLYGRRNDPARAQACYEAAIAARPDHDAARVNLAALMAARGRAAEALGHILQAETFNPLNAEAWHSHAALLQRAGRAVEALAALARAAALDPQYRPELAALERALAPRR